MNTCSKPCEPESELDIVVQRGESLKVEVFYQNEDDTPIDLYGRTIEFADSSIPELMEVGSTATITITDEEGGVVSIMIPVAITNRMRFGRSSWFRIKSPQVGDPINLMSPKIWVNIQ